MGGAAGGAPPKPPPGRIPTYWVLDPEDVPERVIRVVLREDVLESDEAIVAVLAHEMHEINHLRVDLAGLTITVHELQVRIIGKTGWLHLQAWDVGLALLRKMRTSPVP